MDEADKQRYKALYLRTGRVYLNDIKKNIEMLRKNSHNENAIENLYIAVHSLRGQSLMMEYHNLGNYLDGIEKVLLAKKRHILELDYKMLNIVEEGIKKILSVMDDIENGGEESDFYQEICTLQEAAGTKIYV